jgi:hypothetical protein
VGPYGGARLAAGRAGHDALAGEADQPPGDARCANAAAYPPAAFELELELDLELLELDDGIGTGPVESNELLELDSSGTDVRAEVEADLDEEDDDLVRLGGVDAISISRGLVEAHEHVERRPRPLKNVFSM